MLRIVLSGLFFGQKFAHWAWPVGLDVSQISELSASIIGERNNLLIICQRY